LGKPDWLKPGKKPPLTTVTSPRTILFGQNFGQQADLFFTLQCNVRASRRKSCNNCKTGGICLCAARWLRRFLSSLARTTQLAPRVVVR
jgi:hypothetical protein